MTLAGKTRVAVAQGRAAYRYVILGVAFLAQMALSSVSQALLAMAALYQADLGLSRTSVGMIASAGALGHVVILFFAGALADTLGIRRMIVIGLLVAMGGLLLFALAPSFPVMLLGIFIAGFGSSLASPAVTKTVVSWFPPRTRATAMGIKQTGVPLSGVLGALLLLPLGVASGWRVSVVVIVAAVAAIGVCVFALYRDPPAVEAAGRRTGGWGVLRETLALRDVWLVGFLALSLAAAQFIIITYLVIYLKEVLLVPVVVAGGYLALANTAGLGTRVVSGLISDRLLGARRKPLLVAFGVLTTVLLAATAMVGPGTSLTLVAVLVAALGVAAIGSHALFLTLMAELGGTRGAATSVGLGLTLVQLGAFASPPIFGQVVDRTGSYPLAWGIFAVLAAAGAIAAMLVREPRRSA
ncbi:MAG: MFS transporter [Dehalococcoidia bacterium]|nr:MFS transporter [Dehalococcoidia bacterium]